MTQKEIYALVKLGIQLVISLIFVAVGLWFISKGDDLQSVGTGFLGTVIGYWLR